MYYIGRTKITKVWRAQKIDERKDYAIKESNKYYIKNATKVINELRF